MKQELFHPAERQRRYQIIRTGMTTEFWEVLKDSIMAYCAITAREQIALSESGKAKEAERLAIHITALERFIAEPEIIVRENEPLFEKYIMEICKACGHVAKRLKDSLSRVNRGESTTHGGRNA